MEVVGRMHLDDPVAPNLRGKGKCLLDTLDPEDVDDLIPPSIVVEGPRRNVHRLTTTV